MSEVPQSPEGLMCDIRGHGHPLELMWTARHPEGYQISRLRCPTKDYRWVLVHGSKSWFSRIQGTRWGYAKQYDDFPQHLERVV